MEQPVSFHFKLSFVGFQDSCKQVDPFVVDLLPRELAKLLDYVEMRDETELVLHPQQLVISF